MNLRLYLHFLRSNWELIAVSTLVGITVAMTGVLSTTPKFAATSQLFLATPGYHATGNLASYENSPYQADVFTQQRARSYVHLASRPDLASRVVNRLGLNMRPEDLADATSASVQPDTVLIDVTVRSDSPTEAKFLADAVTTELADDIRILEMPSAVVIPTVDPVTTQLAGVPTKPSEPNIAIYLTLGASVGFLVGVTVAAWLERRRTIVGPAVVEQSTNRPVLGAIRSAPARSNLVGDGPLSKQEASSRHWRRVHHNVTFEMEDTPDRVLAVTGVGTTDEASTAAASLACAFACHGSRTVLVATEVNRLDYVVAHEPRVVGLAGAIAGESRLETAIRPTDVRNLYQLAGPGPDNPTPLLQSEKFRGIVDQLRESFDIVIFDAPGFAPQSESTLLPEVVDSVILVVTEVITQKQDLTSVVRLLRNRDVRIMGTIMTSVSREKQIPRARHSLQRSGRGVNA